MLIQGQLQRKEAGTLCSPEAKGNDRQRAAKGLNKGSVYQPRAPGVLLPTNWVQALKHCKCVVTSITGTISNQQSWFMVKICGSKYQFENPPSPLESSGLVM